MKRNLYKRVEKHCFTPSLSPPPNGKKEPKKKKAKKEAVDFGKVLRFLITKTIRFFTKRLESEFFGLLRRFSFASDIDKKSYYVRVKALSRRC